MTLQSESVVLLRTGVPPEPHLRSAWGGITLKIAKKTLPIREVKEVREVRDDKAACPLIQLSQDKDVGVLHCRGSLLPLAGSQATFGRPDYPEMRTGIPPEVRLRRRAGRT